MVIDFFKNGITEFEIVLPKRASEHELYALSELKRIAKLATGFEMKNIFEDEVKDGGNYIILGLCHTLLENAGIEISFEELGLDGYKIVTSGSLVFIAGMQRGTYFGVYTFCNRHFGYKYYAIDETKINKTSDCPLLQLNIVDKPDIEARSLGFHDVFKFEKEGIEDNARRLWLGRNLYTDWILAAHTYFTIMPKEKYFEKNPDFYSPDGSNLCLSNEEMTVEFIKNTKEIIKNSKGNYIMLGQEDNFGFCDCEKCKKARETFPESAIMMQFSNRVAAEISDWLEKEENGRKLTIVTFAYNKTAAPPVKKDKDGNFVPIDQSVVAHKNLAVMIVPFSAVYSHSYFDEIANKHVADNFRGWSAVSKNLHIWTYCTNFDHYMINFNNWATMKENYEIFKDMGVSFVFDQASTDTKTPCFDNLRIFVQSKLLWDTSQKTEDLIDDFLENYYMDIAPNMKQYLNLFKNRCDFIEKVYGEGARSGGGDSSYLLLSNFWTKNFLDYCMEIFREARGVLEALRVKEWDKYVVLKDRLKREALSVRYLLLNIYGSSYGSDLSLKIDNLKNDCKALGITQQSENQIKEIN